VRRRTSDWQRQPSEPLLVDLEQQWPIKEAWLNRTGTIVAIVWSGLARTEEVAKPVFARAVKERLVSVEEAEQIKSDIEVYFGRELLKFRTKKELRQDASGRFTEAILAIYRKHVGMERTIELRAHGIENPFDRTAREDTSICSP
jgi:hypothetical protein